MVRQERTLCPLGADWESARVGRPKFSLIVWVRGEWGVSEGSKAPLTPCGLSIYGLSEHIEWGVKSKYKKSSKSQRRTGSNETAFQWPRNGGSRATKRRFVNKWHLFSNNMPLIFNNMPLLSNNPALFCNNLGLLELEESVDWKSQHAVTDKALWAMCNACVTGCVTGLVIINPLKNRRLR